jgi:hypothetical protein
MLFEPNQREDPEVSVRSMEFVSIDCEPSADAKGILKMDAFSRQEILTEFNLERRGAPIFAVGDKQIYACVLRGNPHIQSISEMAFDVGANQILPGMNREQWRHGAWPLSDEHRKDTAASIRSQSRLALLSSTHISDTTPNNTSGFKGVSFESRTKKWRVMIGFNGRKLWIGRYATVQEAHAHYVAAAVRYFGEFARA